MKEQKAQCVSSTPKRRLISFCKRNRAAVVAKRDIIYRRGGRKEGEKTPPAFLRLEGLGHGDYYRRAWVTP